MRFKEPLTRVELRAIQDRNPNSADVKALLWEIARLRSVILHADQLQRLVDSLPGPQGQVLESMREKLLVEPCVIEFPRLDAA
jgi:hypothetical protein